MKKNLIFAVCVILLSGCYTNKFYTTNTTLSADYDEVAERFSQYAYDCWNYRSTVINGGSWAEINRTETSTHIAVRSKAPDLPKYVDPHVLLTIEKENGRVNILAKERVHLLRDYAEYIPDLEKWIEGNYSCTLSRRPGS